MSEKQVVGAGLRAALKPVGRVAICRIEEADISWFRHGLETAAEIHGWNR